MRYILNNIAAFAFLIGVIPVFLARARRARWVAIVFGVVSIGLGVHFTFSNAEDLDSTQGLRRTGIPIVSALAIALVSACVTFRLDRKHENKA